MISNWGGPLNDLPTNFSQVIEWSADSIAEATGDEDIVEETEPLAPDVSAALMTFFHIKSNSTA